MMEKIFQNAGLGLFHEKLINSKLMFHLVLSEFQKVGLRIKNNSNIALENPTSTTYQ